MCVTEAIKKARKAMKSLEAPEGQGLHCPLFQESKY
jgi:hypothetical protein